MRNLLLLVPLVALVFFCGVSSAQAQDAAEDVTDMNSSGLKVFGTAMGGEIDYVDLNNGGLNLKIPILAKNGRGLGFAVNVTYSSKFWNVGTKSTADGPVSIWKTEKERNGLGWAVTSPYLTASTGPAPCGGLTTKESGFVFHDSEGAKHAFDNYPSSGCGGSGLLTDYSDDMTGMLLVTPQIGGPHTMYLRNGTKVVFNNISGSSNAKIYLPTLYDTNGNKITVTRITDPGTGAVTETWTDTLGGSVAVFRWTTQLDAISVWDSTGVERQFTFTWIQKGVTCNFQTPTCYLNQATGGKVLSQLTLPNGLSYQFFYTDSAGADNPFGELMRVNLPTGGYIRYEYATLLQGENGGEDGTIDSRVVTKRVVSPDGATEHVTNYSYERSYNWIVIEKTTTVTDPLGNQSVYKFQAPGQAGFYPILGFFEVSREVKQGSSTLIQRVQQDYQWDTDLAGKKFNVRVIARTVTLGDTNQVSKTTYAYDSFTTGGYARTRGNITEVQEFGYGTGAPGPLVRRTTRSYLVTNPVNGVDYTSDTYHIWDRLASEVVYDGSGNVKAQSNFSYDSTTIAPTSGVVQHDYTNYSASFTIRGNVTEVKRWRNTGGAWLTTTNAYNDVGNLIQTVDPGNHTTTFDYADSWTNSNCAGGQTRAFPTTITNALGHATTSTYHSCSGTAAATTDPNLRTSTLTYDLMNRLTVTNLPDGGQATTTYNEASTPLSVTRTVKINASLNAVAPTDVDGLGRVTQTRLTSDPQGTVFTDTTYDALGRKKTVSNPYRSTSDSTYGITTFDYDALGRITKVIAPDGTPATNHVLTTYSGNCTTVTDQAGKKRKSCTDALGRLIEVWEPDASGAFIYQTVYTYDVLDNLLTVQQKGNDPNPANWRTRTFTYNSLSQLTQAVNPESGAITYTYDNDGNLLTKTAPKPNQTGSLTVTTTYTYDALHRLLTKSYNDGTTATVRYGYDGIAPAGCTPPTLTFTNAVGRRTQMCDAAGGEAWSYDSMGRVVTDKRTTNGITQTFSYTYNLDGSLATLTYPSGRRVTYTSNAAGRTVSAVDADNPTNPTNYAMLAQYAPHGALSYVRHHKVNNAAIDRTLTYNNRLQPVTIKVSDVTILRGGSETYQTRFELGYNFGLGSANNGNVLGITHSLDVGRNQSFTYDELNRIDNAQSQATSGEHCWGQSYEYDPWGNLHHMNVTQCSAPMLNVTPTFKNQISGFCYDVAGNLTHQGACPGVSYTYDAENRLLTAGGVTYTYDGDGKRVMKSTGKLYWYGAGGDVLLEGDPAQTFIYDEFIFFNSQRIARRSQTSQTNSAVYYFFSDHLGSARIVTNSSGTVVEDSDFYPFGAERVVLDTLNNNYKFTGQERDAESGLDFFIARHYAFTLGRFLQPDEFAGGPVDAFSANDPLPPGPLPYALITNPQSLNKYAYTYNNPLTYSDPNGHSVWTKIVKVIVTGGDIVGTAAAVADDVQTMLGPDAGTLERVEAFGRAGSEFLPLSVSDAEDLGNLAGTGLAALGGANSTGAGPVQPYEVGTTEELKSRSAPGDSLDIHHAPQEHVGKQTIPGYDANKGPAIALPQGEHKNMAKTNVKGNVDMTPRQAMAKTVRDLRKNTKAPRSSLRQLIEKAKELYKVLR